MALPRCCILFTRPLSAAQPVVLRQLVRLSSSQPDPATPPSSLDTHKPVAPTEPYFVRRTNPGNLPVYQTKKRGGNLQETKIKKIEGNITALCVQLQEALGADSKEVKINPLTNDVIIKGWKKLQVTKFLEDRRF
ncbi:MAG: hypothetical protein M1839_008601 [Geoglossum umbratile]|nr:MAG: hypothetical protein M1839_008601 [Geoglossum umbratile]